MRIFKFWIVAHLILNISYAQQESTGTSINLKIDTQWPEAVDKYEISIIGLGPRILDSADVRVDVKKQGVDLRKVILPKLKSSFNGVQISVSKAGIAYRQFCTGPSLKLGKVPSIPREIAIVLKEPKGNYRTSKGQIRNDAYPQCEVILK